MNIMYVIVALVVMTRATPGVWLTISRFNKQFQLTKEEKEAVEWALPKECDQTMFRMINDYTKASPYPGLPADSGYKLKKVGGTILEMVK